MSRQGLVNVVNMVFGQKGQVTVEEVKDGSVETLNKLVYESLRTFLF